MDTRELLSKVTKIEIKTRKAVEELTGGAYHSVYKGRGIEFSEVRPYAEGDDVRDIDWNVTARTGMPYIKKYIEERELTVLLVVDISASVMFGTSTEDKRTKMAETAALLAFSAIRNNDKVGLMLFSNEVEHWIPPRSGRSHVMRILRDLVATNPSYTGTNLSVALETLSRVLKKKAVIFIISDFMDDKDFSRPLQFLSKKHDVAAIRVTDKFENCLPEAAALEVCDLENGTRCAFPGTRRALNAYAAAQSAFSRYLKDIFIKSKVDTIDLPCDEEIIKPLMKFFRMRGIRRGRG